MQLSVRDVAELCDVSEGTVFGWLQKEGLPAEQVRNLYRVNPAELLEWATTRKLPVSPAIFRTMNGDLVDQSGLSDALQRGGVLRDVPGHDRRSTLSALVEGISLPAGFAAETLLELLVARERMGSTAVGDGIAIPHPRNPILFPGCRSVLRVGYLAERIDFGAADGKSVDTLFLLICPTVHDHLQFLARLAGVLQRSVFRQLLAGRPATDELIAAIEAEERALVGSAA